METPFFGEPFRSQFPLVRAPMPGWKSCSYCGWSNSRCFIYQASFFTNLPQPHDCLTLPHPVPWRNEEFLLYKAKGKVKVMEMHLFSVAWLVVRRVHNLNYWCGFLKHPPKNQPVWVEVLTDSMSRLPWLRATACADNAWKQMQMLERHLKETGQRLFVPK